MFPEMAMYIIYMIMIRFACSLFEFLQVVSRNVAAKIHKINETAKSPCRKNVKINSLSTSGHYSAPHCMIVSNNYSAPSEEVFLEERTDAQDVRRDDAEDNDQQPDEDGQRGVHDEVVAVLVEERAHRGQVGQEEEMDEVDVKRTPPDILQRHADDGHLS